MVGWDERLLVSEG